MRQLLPGVIEARQRLGQATQRLQARADAWRVRKEVLKASYTAASASLHVREAIAALGPADDDGDRQHEDSGHPISAAEVRLAELTALMERELGQQRGGNAAHWNVAVRAISVQPRASECTWRS